MVEYLINLKYNHKRLWNFLDAINGFLFSIIYNKRFKKIIGNYSNVKDLNNFFYRSLNRNDIEDLEVFFKKQSKKELRYFEAHDIDKKSLVERYENPSFFMFGVFNNNKIVGYFFIRCFINKKCFIGRFVDKKFRNKGIGKKMNEILYNIVWDTGFRCYSTFSKNNHLIVLAHAKNNALVFRKELNDNYLLVEFLPEKKKNYKY